MNEEEITNPPSPSRITESLRDTGYSLNVAFADIIDNSIDANATNVLVKLGFDIENQVEVSISDNGIGMDKTGLVEALRYGTPSKDDASRLGKFGLGLKFASTSFCRKIEITSRFEAGAEALTAYFDLDTVAEKNKFVTTVRQATLEETAELDVVAQGGTGTIVRWRKIDRILEKYKTLDGEFRRRAMSKLQQQLEEHLGMVFQRFLDTAHVDSKKVNIVLNGKSVQPWDPFSIAHSTLLYDASVSLNDEDGNDFGDLEIKCYVLPRAEEFPDEESQKQARVGEANQGVYIYREDRLIHGPDWIGLYKIEPHYNLARIELNFPQGLDQALQVDIKKSRIILDPQIADFLKTEYLNMTRKLAQERNRKGTAKPPTSDPHQPASTNIGTSLPGLVVPEIKSVDEDKDEATVLNNKGEQEKVSLRIVRNESPSVTFIETAPTLQDGVLWVPSVINGSNGVTINTGHEFYLKSYLPHVGTSPVIQSLDYLLWALAQAEINNTDGNSQMFEDFKIEVSRNLRRLVEKLPDPVTHSEDE
jgi:hypothetical protein